MSLMLAGILPLGIFVIGQKETAYWDWQLTHPYDLSLNVRVLALDADDPTQEDIAKLRARGVKPVCYISVGTWESYRSDKDLVPGAVIGKPPGDWPDENYLDIRQMDVVLPIMTARMDRCAAKGFLAVEADNLGLMDNDTGFDITRDHVLAYANVLADYAHSLGLEIAQKNSPTFVPDLVDKMDFAIVEECFQYDFCEDMLPYRAAGKDVLAVEYEEGGLDWDDVCARAKQMGIHLLLKQYEVTAGGKSCN